MTERTILEWVETSNWKWSANDWQIYRENDDSDYAGFALYFGPITSAYCLQHSIPTLEAAKDLAQRLQDELDESTFRPRKMRHWLFDDDGPDEPLRPFTPAADLITSASLNSLIDTTFAHDPSSRRAERIDGAHALARALLDQVATAAAWDEAAWIQGQIPPRNAGYEGWIAAEPNSSPGPDHRWDGYARPPLWLYVGPTSQRRETP
jgi:hypothetical protein